MTSLFGKNHDNKMVAFDAALASIEEKYAIHLRTVVDHENNEIIDKLSNHFQLKWEPLPYGNLRYGIRFNEDTYIPKFIQEEVISAFKEVFSDQ